MPCQMILISVCFLRQNCTLSCRIELPIALTDTILLQSDTNKTLHKLGLVADWTHKSAPYASHFVTSINGVLQKINTYRLIN